MRRLPGPHRTLQGIYGEILDLIKTEVDQHREDFNPSEPRDFIDCYLNEMEKVGRQNDQTVSLKGINQPLLCPGPSI